jgi:hypothetical protein
MCSRRDADVAVWTKTSRLLPVQMSESIQCPWCGQAFELIIDATAGSQTFTTDCEICCRPMEVVAECDGDEVVSLQVNAN